MNCSQSHDLLQARLDGEAIPDRAALVQHLADCGECRMLHAAAGRLEEGLRQMPSALPPASLRIVIVAKVLEDQRTRSRRRLLVGMALAASLLLAVFVGAAASQGNGTISERFNDLLLAMGLKKAEPFKGITPPEPPVVLQPTERFPVVSFRTSMADAGTAMVSLTRRTADNTVAPTRILTEVLPMPMNVFDAVPPMPEQPIATVWQETSTRVSAGFEPVTSSARRALSMLLRENPRPVNQ